MLVSKVCVCGCAFVVECVCGHVGVIFKDRIRSVVVLLWVLQVCPSKEERANDFKQRHCTVDTWRHPPNSDVLQFEYSADL